MKFTVDRQELLDRLSSIQNIVEKRSTMPILGHFLISASKSGSHITATDIETAVKQPIGLQIREEGSLCLPARKLYEIIKEIDGEVSIETDDGAWIRVKAGHSSFRLACLSADDFPAWPALESADQIKLSPSALETMIEKTIYSSGESDTRYTLNGLLFHIQKNTLSVVGTDGHRMAVIETSLDSGMEDEKKVIVPRKTVSELKKFLTGDADVDILLGKSHILFKIGDIDFLARLIEGTYPNYTQVIPAQGEKTVVSSREDFVKSLRRVSVISRERSNAVKLELSEGNIKLSSSNPDLGEAKDEFQVQYKGDALSMGFNARYMLDVLSAMTSENITMELKDNLSPALMREEGNDQYKCVVMPMRI